MLDGRIASEYYADSSAGSHIVNPSNGMRFSDGRTFYDKIVGYSYINSEYGKLFFHTQALGLGAGRFGWYGLTGQTCSASYRGYIAWNSYPNPYGATRCAGDGALYKKDWW